MRYIVALYEIDRAFGGPEEGGWWYDTGSLRRMLALVATEDAALAIASRANLLLARLQREKRSVESVAYDGGRHRAIVFEGLAPQSFPELRSR